MGSVQAQGSSRDPKPLGSRPSARKEAQMAKVINCDCGYIVRGETDEELLSNANAHIESDHPDMVGKVTNEELLAMAEES
jgi:predicted small metal-binding protein